MGTSATLHLTDKQDSIVLYSRYDGYLSFIIPLIYTKKNEINQAISFLRQKIDSGTLGKTENSLIKEWHNNLLEFQKQPESLTKTSNTFMWGEISHFSPMTSCFPLNNFTQIHDKRVDYTVIQVENKVEMRIPHSPLAEGDPEDPYRYAPFAQYLQNAFIGKDIKIPLTSAITPVHVSDEFALIRVADEYNNGNWLDGNDILKRSSNDLSVIKIRKEYVQKLPEILFTLPVKYGMLFNLWSYSLNQKENPTPNKDEFVRNIKSIFEFFTNFSVINDVTDNENVKINDRRAMYSIEQFSPMCIGRETLLRQLLTFYPNIFEPPTMGEMKYLSQYEELDTVATVFIDNNQHLHLAMPEADINEVKKQVNAKYDELFLGLCKDWNIQPTRLEAGEIIGRKTEYKENIHTNDMEFVTSDNSNQVISMSFLQLIYETVRSYDKSLLQKDLV